MTQRTITPIAEGVIPWPEELARAYTERGWWRGLALGAELLAAADTRPGAVALVDGDIRLTYRSLAARADALASRLVDELGLVREDRIVVQLPSCWQFVVLTLGCLRAGIVPVFLLSGGTTGLPKLIARTHDDYAYNARASAELCGLGPETVYLGTLPASHNFPLACPGILGTMLAGGRVVMLPSPEPQRVFATIAAEGVTVAAAVPAVAQRWLAHATEKGADDVATLRLLQVGGARLADEIARTVRPVLGATLQQVFGMAEGLLNYTRLDDPEDVICTTQGRPMSEGDEVRVAGELGRDVPDGTLGALLTRGPYTPRGYYRATEQNARAFTADGWYRSGDIVRRRPDGNLVVEGRDKDMINRGGEKISAEEVENLAYQLPQITQVAAIAMPDPDLGERVCLYAVLEPDTTLTLEDVRQAMATAGVATFKWPERLEIIAELPATKVGKIDKKALREDIARRLAAA